MNSEINISKPQCPNTEKLLAPIKWGQSITIKINGSSLGINLLEFDDLLFSNNSTFAMPEFIDSTGRIIYLAKLVGHTIKYALLENPQKKAFITGHTDTVGSMEDNVALSTYRASCVYAILIGNRDLFSETANGPHLTDKEKKENVLKNDWIRILDWVAFRFSWNCSLEENGNSLWNAISKFQASYNENLEDIRLFSNENASEISVDGSFGKETCGAVFDLYQWDIASEIGCDSETLRSYQSLIIFLKNDKPYAGCGEYHPIDGKMRDNYRSSTNRRVEILFFDPPDTPYIPCHQGDCIPDACSLYDDSSYSHHHPEYPPKIPIFKAFYGTINSINNSLSSIVAQAGTEITLHWQIQAADQIIIEEVTLDGNRTNISLPDEGKINNPDIEASGSVIITPQQAAYYILSAINTIYYVRFQKTVFFFPYSQTAQNTDGSPYLCSGEICII